MSDSTVEGYPDRLSGEDIPVLARIIAVADTYNAMTSNRPYRGAMSPGVAIESLIQLAGTQLDPMFASSLARVLKRSSAAYRVAREPEFVIDFGRLTESESLAGARA